MMAIGPTIMLFMPSALVLPMPIQNLVVALAMFS